MWEPFTERSRRLIVLTQEKAQLRGSRTIDVGDFISALADQDDAIGAAVRRSVDFEQFPPGRSPIESTKEMVFSRGAKRIIEKAFAQARLLGDNFIGTAHLLLGALEGDPPLSLVAGADPQRFRDDVVAARFGDAPPTSTTS